MKIWILNKLIYWWDVIFTAIDMWQIDKWLKLRNKLHEEEYNKGLVRNKITITHDLEDYNSFEDVK